MTKPLHNPDDEWSEDPGIRIVDEARATLTVDRLPNDFRSGESFVRFDVYERVLKRNQEVLAELAIADWHRRLWMLIAVLLAVVLLVRELMELIYE